MRTETPFRLLGSCDTFVAMPPATKNDFIVFGKNSDRPGDEVQEVVLIPAADHPAGSKVKCTYIEIDQVEHTYSVILSKPSWMWGAEMGANEHGLCIGNEAVWTKMFKDDENDQNLLGMDILRLTLERSKNCTEAISTLTSLLEKYGQGGRCSRKIDFHMAYHNSFLICDSTRAWVVETAGSHWAAQRVHGGIRNISNQLTIGTEIDAMGKDTKEHAHRKGWWNPSMGDFDFAKAYSDHYEHPEAAPGMEPSGRQQWGAHLLQKHSKDCDFAVEDMMSILRHTDSGICMTGGGFVSTGSQVSVLTLPGCVAPTVHWFTATPDPSRSLFKPFIFTAGARLGDKTTSPSDPDPITSDADLKHPLWEAHEKVMIYSDTALDLCSQLRILEQQCLADIEQMKLEEQTAGQAARLFEHMVNLEMNFYEL